MEQVTVPDWLKKLPSDSSLNVRDMTDLFGGLSKRSTQRLVRLGVLPKPSWKQKGLAGGVSHQWYVKDVIEFINQKGVLK